MNLVINAMKSAICRVSREPQASAYYENSLVTAHLAGEALRRRSGGRHVNAKTRSRSYYGSDHPRQRRREASQNRAASRERILAVKLTDCRLLPTFLHEAKPFKLRKAAIGNLPGFRSEPG